MNEVEQMIHNRADEYARKRANNQNEYAMLYNAYHGGAMYFHGQLIHWCEVAKVNKAASVVKPSLPMPKPLPLPPGVKKL